MSRGLIFLRWREDMMLLALLPSHQQTMYAIRIMTYACLSCSPWGPKRSKIHRSPVFHYVSIYISSNAMSLKSSSGSLPTVPSGGSAQAMGPQLFQVLLRRVSPPCLSIMTPHLLNMSPFLSFKSFGSPVSNSFISLSCILRVSVNSQAVMVCAFNPSTWEAG